MNINLINQFVEKKWDSSILPVLMEYIKIPAVSPGFDTRWDQSGFLRRAVKLIENWCLQIDLKKSQIHSVYEKGKTPFLIVEIEATQTENADTILFYGHLDKQPEGEGWDKNKGPFKPVLENNKLFGRGAADDGYSIFTALTAIKSLQDQGIPHDRCVVLIETCEESGSFDLNYYFEKYKKIIGLPDLIICLDSGCCDYNRMWITTSLRGAVVGTLSVNILKEGIHSGNSGIFASSFRIIRLLLDRIEDSKTGDILIDELNVNIPQERLDQIEKTVEILGKKIIEAYPAVDGLRPADSDLKQSLINRTWKATLSYIGVEGIPPFEKAGNVLRSKTELMLSFRIPPTADPSAAAEKIKQILENDPPYGAEVTFDLKGAAKGWNMPEIEKKLEKIIDQASKDCFGYPLAYTGEGGGIPLMNMLYDRFPETNFITTGVLGPHSNAHGPNEFLDIVYVKKLTCAIASILAAKFNIKLN